jgi:hypothetical protein
MMLISFPGFDRRVAHSADSVGWTAPLAQLQSYWESLRQGFLPPFRSQIDPRGIESALGAAFILERVAPGVARFRIAGMQVGELAGCDPRGMPFSVLFDPAGRKSLGGALDTVFDQPAMLTLRVEAERSIGRSPLSGQILILPLRSETGSMDLAVGCLALSGDPGPRTRRFHIAQSTQTALFPNTQPAVIAGFAEPAAGFAAPLQKAASPSERSYLRLLSKSSSSAET